MLSPSTLRRYIQNCDEVIESQDVSAAKDLQKEIIAVLGSSLSGLTRGLTNYSAVGAFTDRNGKTVVVGDDLDFIKDARILRSRLQVELEQIGETAGSDMDNENKPHKLFISHASKDKEYMQALIELLEDIGMPEGSIVCSTIPGYGIPGGADIYNWLRDQFLSCDLRVLFVFSKNYYESAACLNEMGAAWITRATDTLMLLPGFAFSDIKGCVDSRRIGISFDSAEEELKHRLNEFKDILIVEHSLQTITQTRWERHRDAFLTKIREISKRMQPTEAEVVARDYSPVVGENDPDTIPLESSFLLVYAAEADGQIVKIETLGAPPSVCAAGKTFVRDQSMRESAKWIEALDWLVLMGWVKPSGKKGQVFTLTGTGYKKADELKEGMKINTAREPLDELREFEE